MGVGAQLEDCCCRYCLESGAAASFVAPCEVKNGLDCFRTLARPAPAPSRPAPVSMNIRRLQPIPGGRPGASQRPRAPRATTRRADRWRSRCALTPRCRCSGWPTPRNKQQHTHISPPRPPQCKGTLRFVHLSCLRKWQSNLMGMGQAERALICGVCLHKYTTSPPRPYVSLNHSVLCSMW